MTNAIQYTLHTDGTTTIKHPVRFNGWVLGEFDAILGSASLIDATEEPLLHEMMFAVEHNREVAIQRRGNNTYEVFLRLEVVEVFAREVAYYLENHIEMRREGDNDSSVTKVINGCRTALASANKVLEGAGLPAIASYFK